MPAPKADAIFNVLTPPPDASSKGLSSLCNTGRDGLKGVRKVPTVVATDIIK